MRKVEITRFPSTDQGTPGMLVVPAINWSCMTLELPDRGNEKGHSCIDDGTYIGKLAPSSKWSPRPDGRLYMLQNVRDRTAIEIHAATYAGDERKGFKTELLGCIALGMRRSLLRPDGFPLPQTCLLESRVAITRFMMITEGEDIELVIRWERERMVA